MLTATQIATLHAAMDRIIPPDDFPGAWDAGTGQYLDGQLQRDLRPLLYHYQHGLDALDAEARVRTGAPFCELDAAGQDAVLTWVEAGAVLVPWPVDPAIFFHQLVEHTMEGFYCDPGNGGNLNRVSWQMIGFEVRG